MSALQTSFDPMDFFKKLTTCLATKKNCKVNLSRVPGGKEIKENKRLPSKKITSQNLQNKFLAKYNEKRQQHDPDDQNSLQQQLPLGFNLQKKDQNGKRQKPDESIINLPPAYFKSTNVPDLSIFKIPKVPPAKKQRLEAAPNASNNFTLDSLFSGNFRPPKASTPVDEMRPIISDPCDILDAINNSNPSIVEHSKEDAKLIEFLDLVDSVAQKIDSNCFSKIDDPIIGVLNRLNNTHEIATQSPRSSLYGKNDAAQNKTPSQGSLRPIPVFYENSEKQKESIDEIAEEEDDNCFVSIFNKTFSADSILSTSSRAKDTTTSYFFNDQEINSSPHDYLFETSSQTPSPITIDNQSILLTPQPTQRSMDNDEFNWLDEVFNNSMDFDDNDENDDSVSVNIFRSPPASQRSKKNDLQKKFSQAINTRHNLSNNSSIWSAKSYGNNDSVFNISLDLH